MPQTACSLSAQVCERLQSGPSVADSVQLADHHTPTTTLIITHVAGALIPSKAFQEQQKNCQSLTTCCPGLQQAAVRNVHIEFVAICENLEPAGGDMQAAAELSAFGVALEEHENASLQWCRLGESGPVQGVKHLLPCTAQPCCNSFSAAKPLTKRSGPPDSTGRSESAATCMCGICHTCHSACSGAYEPGGVHSSR